MRSVLGSYLLVVTDADHYVVSFVPNRLPNAQLLMMLKQPLIESASVYEYSTGWFFFLSWLKSLIYRTRIRFELGSGLRKNFSVAHSLFILDPSADGFGNARVSSGKLCARVAKIWLFGSHSVCPLIQQKLFPSFISTSSRKFCAMLRYYTFCCSLRENTQSFV